MATTKDRRAYWILVLCASAILMITMGVRQSPGLFVSPLNTATGLGIVTISFALAVGQFVFAPLSQAMIAAFGWVTALWTLAVACLATIPLAFKLGNKPRATPVAGAPVEITLKAQIGVAFQDRSYWCLHAGFFTCGFHIALAAMAALVNLPIREAHPRLTAATA